MCEMTRSLWHNRANKTAHGIGSEEMKLN